MPSSTCFPFFDLPFELQNCILRFCGRADFAKVGRVSRAFLELSSSYLYQDVHIEGFAQLMLLFCRRKPPRFFRISHHLQRLKRAFSRSPRPRPLPIAHLLSLSQIRTLTFVLDPQEVARYSPYYDLEHPLSLSRASSNSPLPLERFTLLLPYPVHPTYEDFIADPHLHIALNPRHFIAKAHSSHLVGIQLFGFSPKWDRLETVKLVGMHSSGRFPHPEAPRRLPPFTFDVSHLEHGYGWERALSITLYDFPYSEEVDVLLLVATEEGREKARALLQSRVAHLSVEQRTRHLAQVRVQIKEVMTLHSIGNEADHNSDSEAS